VQPPSTPATDINSGSRLQQGRAEEPIFSGWEPGATTWIATDGSSPVTEVDPIGLF